MKIADQQTQIICDAFGDNILPPPYIYLDEYADQSRYVPEAASENSGLWDTRMVPHTREIMRCLSPQHPSQNVCWMKGSQVAATETAINSICYRIEVFPTPQLYMQTTDDAINLFSKQRLTPTFEEMPGVKAKLDKSANAGKSKEVSDTIHLKTYVGGVLILSGANSTTKVRSFPAPVIYIDEWDDYKSNLKGQGDIAELAMRRAAAYKRKKFYKFSSPTMDETSKIKPEFLGGDRRFRYAVCPENGCGHKGVILWNKKHTKRRDLEIYETLDIDECFEIVWTDDDPNTAGCLCPSCGTILQEYQKNDMFADEKGCYWNKTKPENPYPSFHLSALYSKKYKWSEAVDLYLKAIKNNDLDKFIVFVNTILGETYKVDFKEFKSEHFKDKLEDYKYVPRSVTVLTCGADIQKDRIECEVVGWNNKEESWSIEYKRFIGDTNKIQVWREFDKFLSTAFKKDGGGTIKIGMTFIDSNFRGPKVYKFCKTRAHRGIYPILGNGKFGVRSYFSFPKRANKYGVKVCTLYVSELKLKIQSHLKEEQCHFPKKDCYNDEFFQMLTAEKLIRKRIGGVNTVKWESEGRRNEALDCRVYALGAYLMLNPDTDYTDDEEAPRENIRTMQNRVPLRNKIKIHSKGVY